MRCFCPSVCPFVAYRANTYRTQRSIVPNIGRKVPHLRCGSHTDYKVKRPKVRVTIGPLMLTHVVPHIFWMGRPTNFELGIRMEDDDTHQPLAPWPPRSKGQGRTVTWSAWAVLAYWPINHQNLHLVLWQRNKTRMTDNRSDLYRSKVKVISSHRLYVSSLPLISGNKLLYPPLWAFSNFVSLAFTN